MTLEARRPVDGARVEIPAESSAPLGVRPIRVAAVAVAPVFYQVPLYRELASDPRVDLTVIYASDEGVRPFDAGFQSKPVQWDVDLLSGYRHLFLKRANRNHAEGGFFGLRGSDVGREIVRGRYDVVWVHGFSYLTWWIAMGAAWLTGKPVLLREEQTLLRQRPGHKRLIRKAVLTPLFRLTTGLYLGCHGRDHFRHFGVPDSRLFWVPYCADNDRLQAQARELAPKKMELRRRFGIEDDAGPVVLFVGKLRKYKRSEVLLNAFAVARERHRCTLLFVGTGPQEEDLMAAVRDRRIPDVHFAGFLNRSEIAGAYASADIFALPSDEPWGMVVNEAANFGLPLVLSDRVGAGGDLVEPNRNGYVVPIDSVSALSEALQHLVEDDLRRREFGCRSLEIITTWNHRAAAEGVVRACQNALGAGSK